MLKACVLEFKGCWDEHVPLINLTYGNTSMKILGWHHLGCCMVDGVDHLSGGLKLVR